jgi:hypothetical protein
MTSAMARLPAAVGWTWSPPSNTGFESLTPWTAVLPAGTLQYRLPRLPPDLIDVWANHTLYTFDVNTVDAPATSYAEFRHDAEPQSRVSWMLAPTAPGKVRLGFQ